MALGAIAKLLSAKEETVVAAATIGLGMAFVMVLMDNKKLEKRLDVLESDMCSMDNDLYKQEKFIRKINNRVNHELHDDDVRYERKKRGRDKERRTKRNY